MPVAKRFISGGSSPRVRGKRSRRVAERAERRLIPACAGKTQVAAIKCSGTEAHPRVCGENLAARDDMATRAWLIPACAGKTSETSVIEPAKTAHPRVCGENGLPGRAYSLELGSSPRVRGKPGEGFEVNGAGGLIPACAGKTLTKSLRVIVTQAHPRVCGENLSA